MYVCPEAPYTAVTDCRLLQIITMRPPITMIAGKEVTRNQLAGVAAAGIYIAGSSHASS